MKKKNRENLIETTVVNSTAAANSTTVISNKPIRGGVAGFLLALFFNFIGLIIATCKGDDSCKESAIKTFLIELAIGGILIIIGFLVFILIQATHTSEFIY